MSRTLIITENIGVRTIWQAESVQRKSISTNAISLIAARVASAGASVLVAVVAARNLQPGAFGTYVALIALGFVANTAITFGTDTLVVRSIAARSTHGAEVGKSIGLQLAIATPLVVAGLVFMVFGGDAIAVGVVALGLVPGVWSTTALAVLRGNERMDLAAAATTIGAGTTVGATAIVAVGGGGIVGFVAAIVAGQTTSAAAALTLAASRDDGSWRPVFDRTTWAAARPFALMVLASALAASVGVFSLRIVGSEVDTGLYGAANRISEGLRLVPAAVFGAAFPAMTRGVHRDERYRIAIRRLTWGVSIAVVATLVLADPLIDILYGGFEDSARILQVLAIGLVPLTARTRISFELIAEGSEHSVSRISMIAAAATVTLCMLAAWVGGPTLVASASVGGLSIHAALLWKLQRQTRAAAS